MINITDTARDKLKDVFKQNAKKYLRINMDGVG